MKRDAESHAAEDKKRRETVDLKNKGDAMLISTRKSLEEHGGRVSQDVRGKIESAMSDLETQLKGDDKAQLERAMSELEKASMELGKIVYEEAAKAASAGGGATDGAAGASTAKKDDVIDAEYKVKE
jgi:molecular chaperone DnaK